MLNPRFDTKIKSENRNVEKQCSLFNNLFNKKSSIINKTKNDCFPEIIASLPDLSSNIIII